MIILSYDIADNKLRSRFNKYICKFGYRLQYSVYEIENSKHILNNIMIELENTFAKQFTQSDSVMIFNMSETCEIKRFGYAKNDESDIIIV
ncbi:MAG: CRISPR-associated endonuclease Cas2 [Phascolarctobacterium sp.]|nr:CRISPR-associated endonuclease Cas2 [Candidatus Phascolarctobacterium caballi]